MAHGVRKREWFIGSLKWPLLVLLAGALALVIQLSRAPLHLAGANPEAAKIAELASVAGQRIAVCAREQSDQPIAPDHCDCDNGGLSCELSPSAALVLSQMPFAAIIALGKMARPILAATIFPRAGVRSALKLPRGPPLSV
jgi:hypothetical protein